MGRKRTTKSEMKPILVDTEYTIFDALLETLQKKEQKKSVYHNLYKYLCSPLNLTTLLLMIIGLVTIIWVGYLVWCDIIYWGKDIALILFGSRIGEPISLGIGMKVIYYLLFSIALFSISSFILIRNRRLRVIKS